MVPQIIYHNIEDILRQKMMQLNTQTGIKYSPLVSLGEPDVVLTIKSDLSLAPNFNEQI
jgi:hypothetical protein